MHRPLNPPPMSNRVAAGGPITPELLAAVAGQPLVLAQRLHAAWLGTARSATANNTVVVFDTFVFGRPDPFLREAADRLRQIRRADARGDYLDEEDRFYEEHADDDDALFEPPTHADRVIESFRHCADADRLLDDGRFGRMMWAVLDLDRSNWLPHIWLAQAMERLVLELADAIHIDGAVAIDARLPGERVDSLRWAA